MKYLALLLLLCTFSSCEDEDGSSLKYLLQEIVSREQASTETTFNLRLRSITRGIDQVVFQDAASKAFNILEEKDINCQDLCDELSTTRNNQNEVTGVFRHGQAGEILLEQLIIK